MSKKTLAVVVLIGIAVVVGTMLLTGTSPFFGNIQAGTTTTTASSTASGTAQLILTGNTGAQFRYLINRNAVVTWLTCNATSTGHAAGLGYALAASGTLVMDEEAGTMWCTDSIWGITSTGTSSIGVMERY